MSTDSLKARTLRIVVPRQYNRGRLAWQHWMGERRTSAAQGNKMSDSRLLELRGQVDVINLQILELLNKRAEIASEIGKVQTQLGRQFYDPQREAAMLLALERNNKGPFSN